MVLSTEWSQVEVIDLLNDGNGLGFILVGGKSTGVVIKALTPGGLAERDGRMQCGDHVLQIGEVNLRGFSSEQAATVLRQMGAQVRLIVARPVEPTSPDYQALASHAPIIPTKLLTDPDELERQLLQSAAFSGPFFSAQDAMLANAAAATAAAAAAAAAANSVQKQLSAEQMQLQLQPHQQQHQQQRAGLAMLRSPTQLLPPSPCAGGTAPLPLALSADGNCGHSSCGGYESESSAGGPCGIGDDGSPPSLPETECFDVVLHRNVYGLGIRVAGYVCVEEDLSGIFVKSMVEGGAGEAGRVRINDRILAVDGRSVAEATNHEAVTLLKNSGISVHLRIERFLRGRKYEHLQVALNDMKEVNISTAAASPATPTTPAAAAGVRPLTLGGSASMPAPALPTTSSSAATPSLMGRMVGSDTMQSMAALSLPPSPSCATLTWIAPQTDADSLATIDIDYPDVSELYDQPQSSHIAAELGSHTTGDSDVFVVHCTTTNGARAGGGGSPSTSSICSSAPTTPKSPSPTTSPPPPLPTPTGIPLSVSAAHMLELFPPLPAVPKVPKPPAQRPQPPPPPPPLISDSSDEASSGRRRRRPPTASARGHPPHQSPTGHIIVAQLNKLTGLGISLEGTVEVLENGAEVRPHHFIRSILDDGPVALEGSLRPGDEILQLNEHLLSGLPHIEVVRICKELPDRVRMVCKRGPLIAPSQMGEAEQRRRAERQQQQRRSRSCGRMLGEVEDTHTETASPATRDQQVQAHADEPRRTAPVHGGSAGIRLAKAMSESSLYTVSTMGAAMDGDADTPGDGDDDNDDDGGRSDDDGRPAPKSRRPRSRSWEQMSSLALWSSEVVYVELLKTECGFGFSVLDYQDPLDMDGTVIVVRGLIPGGAAESSQRLFPGDRIVSVGGVQVQGMQLDDAVLVLKAVPVGRVRIGLCRPLPARYDDLTDGGSTPT